jgi:ADP-ribose pyrophosphatase YjhB (NUDIX family)
VTRPPQPKIFVSVAVLDGDRLLLVQEEKPDVRGQWNLPGGHLHAGELVGEGACRELEEETELALPMSALLGVYTTPRSVRVVFIARADGQTAGPGDEIMDVRWATLDEVRALADHEVSAPPVLRAIVNDLDAGVSFPLKVLVEDPT